MKTPFEHFKSDISVVQIEEDLYEGNVSDMWSIGTTPNGGYTMALAAKAISESLEHKDPLIITANYLNRVNFGKIDIKVETLPSTRSLSSARATMIQDNEIKVIFTATFTDLSKSTGLNKAFKKEPIFEKYEDCHLHAFKEGFNPGLEKFIEKKYCSDSIWWKAKDNNQNKNAVLNLYMSWPDKEKADLYSLILFLDATTPPIFNNMGSVGWVPTISLTSHIRSYPSEGPLKVTAKTEFITSGYIEEDREIWDSKGNLVGQSKQLAKLRIKK